MHKLTAGDGYQYLLKDIAITSAEPDSHPRTDTGAYPSGDLDPDGQARSDAGQVPGREVEPDAASYYTAPGNPPGHWLGNGLAALDLAPGAQVNAAQMRALFGEGLHPDAERIIASHQEAAIRAGMTDRELAKVSADAVRAAQLGAPFPRYTALAPFEQRVRDRLAVVEAETGREPTSTEVARIRGQEAGQQRHAIAGYDLVFTPVKSVSLLWALHPDPAIRTAARQAHDDAVASTMAMLEQHAAYTRTGKAGIAQIDTHGLVAVAFDHYDSRDGDPNLHTHVVISNKIQGSDGKWRSLDARPLYAMTVAASELYNTTVQALLTQRLGMAFEPRSAGRAKQPVWEIAGIPSAWVSAFSQRRNQIGPRYDQLIAEYQARHGRDPSPAAAHHLARQATLETRQGKKPPQSLAAKRAAWTTDLARRFGSGALTRLQTLVAAENAQVNPVSGPVEGTASRIQTVPAPWPRHHSYGLGVGPQSGEPVPAQPASPPANAPSWLLDELAGRAVATLSEQRSTWTIWNLHAEAERLLRDPATHHQQTSPAPNAGDWQAYAPVQNPAAAAGPGPSGHPHHPASAPSSLAESGEAPLTAAAIAAHAIGPRFSVQVDAPDLVPEPSRLRRRDGESVFRAHAATRYTSRAVLEAETRLVRAARTVPDRPGSVGTGPVVPAQPSAGVHQGVFAFGITADGGARQALMREVSAALDGFEAATGTRLDDGQRHLVTVFATDPRLLVAGIGAAGTGKTTAMRAYLHVHQKVTRQSTPTRAVAAAARVLGPAGREHPRDSRSQPRIVPLATSSASAAVLAGNLGLPAENLHKFLHEHLHGPARDQLAQRRGTIEIPGGRETFALAPGDVILVDEAGLAGTRNLDRLLAIARHHGATLRLLGDYRQLAAVETGGALRLITREAGAAELTTLHRFTDPAEAAATLQLRIGDTTGLDFYETRSRIHGGSASAMTEAAYTGWLTDMRAGLTTFMPAATNTDVTALSARARLDRVAAGAVEPGGVSLHDGNLAGAGDWIVTRLNDRRLTTGAPPAFPEHCRGKRDGAGPGQQAARGLNWVRNGDPWHVQTRYPSGALTVRHLTHGGRVHLPPAYVAEHVELLYATTIHRVEGSTVDTAHPLVTDAMSREHLYVALTRASQRTTLYVATHDVLPFDDDERLDAARRDPDARAALQVLHQIITREGAELSATETIRASQDDTTSLATLIPRYLHAGTRASTARLEDAALTVLGPGITAVLTRSSDWPSLVRALRRAEAAGWTAEQVIAAAAARTPDPLEALHSGPSHAPGSAAGTDVSAAASQRLAIAVDATIEAQPAPARLTRPTLEQATRYAHLVGDLTGIDLAVLDPNDALQNPNAPGPASAPAPQRGSRAPDGTETPSRHVYAREIGHALGSALTNRALRESAYPALLDALRNAETAGHDPALLLERHAVQRELRRSPVISQEVAHRIWVDVLTRPASSQQRAQADNGKPLPLGAINKTGSSSNAGQDGAADSGRAWRTLAWALAGHDARTGRAPLTLHVSNNALGPARDTASLISDVTHALLEHRVDDTGMDLASDLRLPAWVPPPPADDPYLTEMAAEIQGRVTRLGEQAADEKPSWAAALGSCPDVPLEAVRWKNHAGVVAAYRELNQIDDTAGDQILGPYIESGADGRAAHSATSYALAAAREIAAYLSDQVSGTNSVPAPQGADAAKPPTGDGWVHSAARDNIVLAVLRGLPSSERLAVVAGLVATDEAPTAASASRNLFTSREPLSRAEADRLHTVLVQRGHLSVAGRVSSSSAEPKPGQPLSARHERRPQARPQKMSTPNPPAALRVSPTLETRRPEPGPASPGPAPKP